MWLMSHYTTQHHHSLSLKVFFQQYITGETEGRKGVRDDGQFERQQDELRCVAKSSHHIISAIADTERGLYGVQLHVFTENGRKMLHNFLFDLWIVRRFHIGETQAAMYRLQPMYSRT